LQTNVSLEAMQKPIKLALGAAGGLVVAVGVVVITASAAGIHLTGAAAAPSPSPTPSPSATARAGAQANPAARLVNQGALQAEAQVLGLQPKELTKDVRQGTTVHQLATQKGIAQADFQGRFTTALKAILDQDVQQGQLTSQQEQQALKRLANRIPNWDQVPQRAAQPSPSPSPTA
jgi:membrane-bound lytic murein transglycosylase B